MVTFADNFQSAVLPGDAFTLVSTTNATGLSGTFALLANGTRRSTADGLGSFQVSYLPNSFVLSNFEPIPEPSTCLLFAAGVGIVVAYSRRKQRRAGG